MRPLLAFGYSRLAGIVSAVCADLDRPTAGTGALDEELDASGAVDRIHPNDGRTAAIVQSRAGYPANEPSIRLQPAVSVMIRSEGMRRPVKIGVGGPVGSGKTALLDCLCKAMRDSYQLGVVTNDIFTREDMEFLMRSQALPADRIIGVETGGCPHTAIREDASINFEAIAEMQQRFPNLDILFLESGGDNLAASFSPELVDASIYVIDVAGGDKVPRKGGPGITRSDLLVINKTDLAPHVGADLAVMDRDSRMMRGTKPFVFTNLKTREGVDDVIAWIRHELCLRMTPNACSLSQTSAAAAAWTLTFTLQNGETFFATRIAKFLSRSLRF